MSVCVGDQGFHYILAAIVSIDALSMHYLSMYIINVGRGRGLLAVLAL